MYICCQQISFLFFYVYMLSAYSNNFSSLPIYVYKPHYRNWNFLIPFSPKQSQVFSTFYHPAFPACDCFILAQSWSTLVGDMVYFGRLVHLLIPKTEKRIPRSHNRPIFSQYVYDPSLPTFSWQLLKCIFLMGSLFVDTWLKFLPFYLLQICYTIVAETIVSSLHSL